MKYAIIPKRQYLIEAMNIFEKINNKMQSTKALISLLIIKNYIIYLRKIIIFLYYYSTRRIMLVYYITNIRNLLVIHQLQKKLALLCNYYL